MSSVGLPVPMAPFATVATATATIDGLLKAMGSVGDGATVGDLLIAAQADVADDAAVATANSALVDVAGISAGYFMGACVGALIYAVEMVSRDSLSSEFSSSSFTQSNNILEKARRCRLYIPSAASGKVNLALAQAMLQKRPTLRQKIA
jgi:hypothetical protein